MKGRYLRGFLPPYWGRLGEVALLVPLSWPASGPARPLAWPAVQHEVQLYFDQLELSPQQWPADHQVLLVLWLDLLKIEGRGVQAPGR